MLSLKNYDGIKMLENFANEKELIESIKVLYKHLIENLNKVYIFGAKELGKKILKQLETINIEVSGFIDNDTNKTGKEFSGKKIFQLENLNNKKNSIIVVASTNYFFEMTCQLKRNGFNNIIPFALLPLLYPNNFTAELAFKNMQKDIIENKEEYINLFSNLADEESRLVLNELIKFRLKLNVDYIKKAFDISGENELQYFDKKIIQFNDNEVFLDGGGFNGDTTLNFVKLNPNYKKIYFFEPDINLIEESKLRLKKYNNIEFLNMGISNKKEILHFNSTGDLGGNFSESGDMNVMVTDIDSVIKEKITFIKLDVEGYESRALKGLKHQIKENKPKMSIASYHNCYDIWKLYKEVIKLNNNYRVYLRQYTKSYFDADLYFV